MDFSISEKFYDEFKRVLKLNQPGFRVDLFHGSMIFMTDLPEDYLEKSIKIKTDFKNIDLRTLHPIDIVLTKVARMSTRDAEDIETCIEKFNLTKNEIKTRSKQIQYPGNEKVWIESVNRVLNQFCTS